MYECIFLNLENGKRFSKYFDSPYLMEKFLKKCKYSKKIQKVGEIRWG